jgi:preprotein translocase subunit SecE
MGKKNKKKVVKEKVPVVNTAPEKSQVLTEAKEVVSKPNEKTKKVKKERKGSRLVKRLKETGSELKKVTWPTFPKVVKQTGVVLAVVVFFGLVLFGFDYLLKFLFELLVR